VNVFDSSAVLAIMYDEPGRAVAEARLDGGVISTVNVAEVLGDYVASGRGDLSDARDVFDGLRLPVVAPDYEQAARAAGLRRRGLSLGDRFCLALGEAQGERIVTGDQLWADVTVAVPIEFIR
jgi:PIN domain nuclease of toxin-antitoxin system